MTEAEYIGSELQAADAMRIVHEKRIAELEAAVRFMHEHSWRALKANQPREGKTLEPTKAELAAEFIGGELDAVINAAVVALPDLGI